MQLTDEQRKTIHELQRELRDLNLQADIAWAKYMHTGDEECFEEVQSLDGQIEMKGLIAYIPKAGERKISKVRKLLAKVQGREGEDCDGCDLGKDEVRLSSLESVNAWREEYELPPLDRLPRGVPGDAQECTLAMAFKMSLVEMGLDDPAVTVNDHRSITLSGRDADGNWVKYSPKLDQSAHDLIQGFDDNAWLDLLSDGSLMGYADQKAGAEEGDPDVVNLERLQEIGEEFALRGTTYKVEVCRFRDTTEYDIVYVPVTLGKDQKPVSEQVGVVTTEY